ncbi:hypothetical protein ARMGADRAFT_483511 [Armillaria gallica]|uniref:Uncharacterized protein n=1 Tax=Armillaria gallica TaxID=47427 RepID=A0A2H3EI18_ARMGA|nr:hypothetical protein ARMGADRAFT_483511 [Armillaria gallica]
MEETMSFPSVDDLRKPTDLERLREDVRGFGYESEGDGVSFVELLSEMSIPTCYAYRAWHHPFLRRS